MDLLNRETFFRRVALRECIISGGKLQNGEFLVSAVELPALYRSEVWSQRSTSTLRKIVELLVTSKDKISLDSADSIGSRVQIRRFLEGLLDQRELVPEFCVHAFVYPFWNEIHYQGAVIPPKGEVFFTSGSLEGRIDPESKYYKLLHRLKSVTNVDLIAISEEQQHIFLIEIKRGALDDRAVGQVLRYFNESNKLLTDRVTREFDISYVRPVLVLADASKQYMEAFPTHFREVLDIFEYTTTHTDDGQTNIVLAHLRKRFLSTYMN